MRTTADGLGSISVRRLVLAGSTLYAATGAGLSISTDGGTTFVNYTTGLASVSVNTIAVSGATVYAATDLGLSISSDGGHTFTATRTTANGLGDKYVGAIAFDGTRLYVGNGTPFSTSATSVTNRSLALSATTECVYASVTTVWLGSGCDLQKSVGGAAFSVVQSGTGMGSGIAVSGTGFYFATTSGLWVSNSSGASGSFTLKGTADGLGSAYLWDVAVDGSGKVLAATDSGLS